MRLTPLALVLVLGCASGPRATLPQLQHRATYDLACPPTYLRLAHVDPRTKIVSGCGRTLVYMEDCMEHGSDLLCSWRIDAPPMARAGWPAATGSGGVSGRVYRTHLYDDDYRHLENRTVPPKPRSGASGRKVKTDLFGDGASEVPPDILEGRE